MSLPQGTEEWPELRHVAALFADLQGFTRVCERLDPEEVVEVLNGIFARLGEVVQLYGGHLDKVLGDGLLVLFGAPTASGDDGLRAVMAGLAMQAAMVQLQPWIQEKLGHTLGLRVGIDAGPTVYGKVGPGEDARPTVIGDAVNVASRLQRLASAGQVVVSNRAKRLVGKRVQFRSIGTVQLEGRREGIGAYLALAPAGGYTEATATALIGREQELGHLLGLLRGALHEGRTSLILLSGEAGIGKSRLLFACEAELTAYDVPKGARVLHVANRWELGKPYRPAACLGGLLEPGARQLLAEGSPGANLPALVDEGALSRLLAAKCREQPTVILVDDWDWAPAAEQRVLLLAIAGASGCPLGAVIAGRHVELPAGLELDAGLRLSRLRVGPLAPEDAWALLQSHPAGAALPPQLAQALVQQTAGNPSHLMEWVEQLVEDGLIAPSANGWQAQVWSGFAPPDALRNDILGRIDALGPAEKRLLRLCAVIGEEIPWRVLQEVVPADLAELQKPLQRLVEAGLLTTTGPHEEGFRFRSPLVREVAYSAMLKRQKKELHRAIALALLQTGQAAAGLEAALAWHVVQGELGPEHCQLVLAAAEQCLQRGKAKEAIAVLQAVPPKWLAHDAGAELRRQALLADAHLALGAYAEASNVLASLLGKTREPRERARVLTRAGWVYALQGKANLAARHLEKARGAGDALGPEDAALVAAAFRLLYDRP